MANTFVGNPSNIVKEIKTATATVAFTALADGASAATDVTVTGAAVGDVALVTHANLAAGLTLTATVSAANTVTIRLTNNSGGSLGLSSGTATILLFDMT